MLCIVFSLDIDHENIDYGYELLERLDSEELTELRKYFYEKKVDGKVKEPKGSAHPRFQGCKLTKDEFVSAIENVLGKSEVIHSLGGTKLVA